MWAAYKERERGEKLVGVVNFCFHSVDERKRERVGVFVWERESNGKREKWKNVCVREVCVFEREKRETESK